MNCNDVRNIIDQIRNREIPRSALDDLMPHIDNCGSCNEYLDDSLSLIQIMSACCDSEESNPVDDLFSKFEEEIEINEPKMAVWEQVVYHPYAKYAAAAVVFIAVFSVGAFAFYSSDVSTQDNSAEFERKASVMRLPDGAILMKTADGQEITILDPAVEEDGDTEAIMKELEEALGDSTEHNERYDFVSY